MSSPSRVPFRRERPAAPSRLSPSTWTGALVIMVGVAALLWIIEAISSVHSLTHFGLQPRHVVGLRGIVTEPFLHASYKHILSNTIPLILIGWVVLLAGVRTFLITTAIVVLGGGALTWLVAPDNQVIVGASGMIFGWIGFLLARAIFSREVKWILVAVAVLFFFGTLLFGLFPTLHSNISWQAHVCGFVAGVVAAALLHHPRGGEGMLGRRSLP